MSKAPDWDKINRQRRLHYVPSPRTQPATQKQHDYIVDLAFQKNQPPPRLPKTRHGAGELIERLLLLPDVNERLPVRTVLIEPQDTSRQEVVNEMREHYPMLSPMTVHSMVQIFEQIDPAGFAFVLDGIFHEDVPEETDALILHLLQRFLTEIAPVTTDDATALVPG